MKVPKRFVRGRAGWWVFVGVQSFGAGLMRTGSDDFTLFIFPSWARQSLRQDSGVGGIFFRRWGIGWGDAMSFLDRFSNPLWYKASRLDKPRRRTVATVLCSYDFLRQQVEKKLVGPAETYLRENRDPSQASIGLTLDVRTQLVDEALMALLWSCTCPAFDPGLKVLRHVVPHLPEVWGTFVLGDVNHRLNRSTPATLDQTGYSEDPVEAHRQLLSRWSEILGVADPEFVVKINAGGFAEAWDWLTQMFIADTLAGMAGIPNRLLFSQARRLSGTTPPHRAVLVERFIEQIAAGPGKE